MKEITSIKEVHSILLDIAKEFHRICTKHNIPYYMLGGTMLGAIRHKGFIPWDDDMDFGVPREHCEHLKQVLKTELPDHYRMFTMDNSETLLTNIVKIADVRTEIFEIYRENISERIGVNIDIFPLDSVDKKAYKHLIVYRMIQLQYYIFLSAQSRSFIKKIISWILKLLFFPLSKKSIIGCVENYLLVEGDFVANIYGAWGIKEVVPQSVMGKPQFYDFEDTKFFGVENPSIYLSNLYKNYMELPPENQRHIHIKNVYWK